MKTVLIVLGVLAAAAVICVLFVIGQYNGLVNRAQAVDAQWAQVQNVYQRRADLIPNLVATVSGAANFEKSTLTEITNARASVGKVQINPGGTPSAAQLAEFEKAQGALSSALSRLLVVSEQYPALRATANFQTLQAQLEGTENRISVERERFNEVVRTYDTAVHSFPSSIMAGIFSFHDKPYFAAAPQAQSAPTVNFPTFK